MGEADRIVTFLTPDFGKLRAVARGVRKIKSRLAGHLELFSEVELLLAKGRSLDIVAGARLKRHFSELSSNWQSLTFGYLMAEMLERLTEEGPSQARLFDLAGQSFSELNRAGHSQSLELAFKLRLLDALGYRPHLSDCVVCGRQSDTYYFDPKLGGVVDSGCALARPFKMNEPTRQLWLGLLNNGSDTRRPISDIRGSLPIIDALIEQTFGLRFASRQMMEGSVGR